MKRNSRVGFTLVELLVVITVLGILMGVLLPGIFKNKEKVKAFACKGNLGSIYQHMLLYKERHGDRWPKESGAQFILRISQEKLFEPTKEETKIFFCPACLDGDEEFDKSQSDPVDWLQNLEDVSSEHTSYAGRDMKQYGTRLGDSNMKVIICDDNEGGTNHPDSIMMLMAGGTVREVLYEVFKEKGLMDPEEESIIVGPDSPINYKGCDLTKVKLD